MIVEYSTQLAMFKTEVFKCLRNAKWHPVCRHSECTKEKMRTAAVFALVTTLLSEGMASHPPPEAPSLIEKECV